MPLSNVRIHPIPTLVTDVRSGGLEHALWSRVYYGAQFPLVGRSRRVVHAEWVVTPSAMLADDWDAASAVLGVNLRGLSAQEELTRSAGHAARIARERAARYRMMRAEIEPLPLPG